MRSEAMFRSESYIIRKTIRYYFLIFKKCGTFAKSKE